MNKTNIYDKSQLRHSWVLVSPLAKLCKKLQLILWKIHSIPLLEEKKHFFKLILTPMFWQLNTCRQSSSTTFFFLAHSESAASAWSHGAPWHNLMETEWDDGHNPPPVSQHQYLVKLCICFRDWHLCVCTLKYVCINTSNTRFMTRVRSWKNVL